MDYKGIDWRRWKKFFESRKERALPRLESPDHYAALPPSLARSLAIFQLGESGGGTIVEQSRNCSIDGIDRHYSDAMALFVKEENRHAELLAICVRNLGGELIHSNWTAKLFVYFRRLIGLRLKVLVLLTAEVVGICYYHLLATRLPPTRLKSLLADIVNDERAHLYFHCDFLRSQTDNVIKRAVFVLAWRATMVLAAIVVLIDHRSAVRDLNLDVGTVWRRWMVYSRLAERLVVDDKPAAFPDAWGLDTLQSGGQFDSQPSVSSASESSPQIVTAELA